MLSASLGRMDTFDLHSLRNLAIVFIYTVLFATAALDKLKGGRAPDWFVKSFDNTLVSKLPGGAVMGFWIIALLETALAIAFPASVFVPVLLRLALTLSLFLFGLLCFGLRISGDFQGSANMFIYFGASLLSLSLL